MPLSLTFHKYTITIHNHLLTTHICSDRSGAESHDEFRELISRLKAAWPQVEALDLYWCTWAASLLRNPNFRASEGALISQPPPMDIARYFAPRRTAEQLVDLRRQTVMAQTVIGSIETNISCLGATMGSMNGQFNNQMQVLQMQYDNLQKSVQQNKELLANIMESTRPVESFTAGTILGAVLNSNVPDVEHMTI